MRRHPTDSLPISNIATDFAAPEPISEAPGLDLSVLQQT